MANTKSLKDNAIVLIFSKVLIASGSILVGMMLVRFLTKYEYGTFLQVNLIVDTLTTLAIFSIPGSMFYFVPKQSRDHIKRFMLQTICLLGTIGLLYSLLILLFRQPLSVFMKNKQISDLVWIIVVLLFGNILGQYLEPFYITTERAAKVAKINGVFFVVKAVTISVLLFMGHGILIVFITIGILSLVKFGIVLSDTVTMPGVCFDRQSFGKDLMKQLKFSYPIGSSKIVTTINKKIDQFMVSSWFTPAEFAIYGRGAFDLPLISMIVVNVSNVILPKLVEYQSNKDRLNFLDLWNSSIKKIALITYPIIVFFFVFAPEIFVILFTKAYIQSAVIFRIYLVSELFRLINWGNIHISHNNTKVFLMVNFARLVLNISLNIILYKSLGMYGPAVATVFAVISGVVLHIWIAVRSYDYKARELIPLKHLFSILLFCLILGGTASMIKMTELNYFLKVSCGLGGVAVPYLVLVLKSGLLSQEDKNYLLGWLKRHKRKTEAVV